LLDTVEGLCNMGIGMQHFNQQFHKPIRRLFALEK